MSSQEQAAGVTQPQRRDGPITPPRATEYDPDWQERIRIAKQAHEEARKAREGKPATFSNQLTIT